MESSSSKIIAQAAAQQLLIITACSLVPILGLTLNLILACNCGRSDFEFKICKNKNKYAFFATTVEFQRSDRPAVEQMSFDPGLSQESGPRQAHSDPPTLVNRQAIHTPW